MREASDILATPAAMQIRYLETLTNMSKNSGTKVIFMPPAMDNKAAFDNIKNQLLADQL
jgi:regulator of protease activity HflC (stomatin/prohibitin superfamily)